MKKALKRDSLQWYLYLDWEKWNQILSFSVTSRTGNPAMKGYLITISTQFSIIVNQIVIKWFLTYLFINQYGLWFPNGCCSPADASWPQSSISRWSSEKEEGSKGWKYYSPDRDTFCWSSSPAISSNKFNICYNNEVILNFIGYSFQYLDPWMVKRESSMFGGSMMIAVYLKTSKLP